MAKDPNKPKKPLFKRVWFWILIVFVVAAVAGGGSGSGSKSSVSSNSDSGQGTSNSSDTSSQEESAPYEAKVARFDYYTNSIGNFEYHGIVEVKNTSDHDLYLDAASSSFDIEDANGHLITTEKFISSCPDVIAPGETGYFYNGFGGDTADMSVDASQTLNLVSNVNVEKARVANVRYPVTDTAISVGSDGSMHVTGRVENNTDVDDSMMYVQAELFDANGNILAIMGTTLTDLTAGSKQSFDISAWGISETVTADQVASFQVVANKSAMQF